MDIQFQFDDKTLTYNVDDRDLREQIIYIIQTDTGLSLDDAIRVFDKVLRINDLVLAYAKKHIEELEIAFYPKAYEIYKDFEWS